MPWSVLLLVLALVFAGPGVNGQIGFLVGALAVPTLLAALVTWLIARRSSRAWPLWRLALVSLPFFLLWRLISLAGQLSSQG